MKIKIILINMLFVAILLFSGCINNVDQTNSDKISVVTTLFPLYEFTTEVGKENVEVTLLLPPGAEAHTFEPKPSDVVKINNADVFIYIGAGMEPWAHDILEGVNNNNLIILDASSKVTLLKSEEDEEHSHGHDGEEHGFEWAGVFDLNPGNYNWSFAKVEGEYADPSMKMVILQSEDIESVEEEAETLLESDSHDDKYDSDQIIPAEVAYLLNFNETKNITMLTIIIAEEGKYAFFTEHMPTEFESTEHFFKDINGTDIEPIMTEPESEEDHHHDDEEEDHHHHGEYDPHIWLDFENDQNIVSAIAESLSQIDPTNEEFYLNNADEYNEKLGKLHMNYTMSLSNCTQKVFISGGHNAFSYLAHKYDLETISAYGISPDSEPTPQTIKDIIDLTEEYGIHYIYFEKLVDPGMAETIADEAGAETLVLNPAHNLLKEEFEQGVTFISLMEENLKNLKIGLECE